MLFFLSIKYFILEPKHCFSPLQDPLQGRKTRGHALPKHPPQSSEIVE